jgi:predicted regulator of Ras-like GTPase activity (Roadblock/LC7/MglB family)
MRATVREELGERLGEGSAHTRSMSTVRFSDVDTASALADLSEISSQIESAVVFDSEGTVLGSTGTDEMRAKRLARTALDLVAAAGQVGPGSTRRLTQIEGSLREGSIFVVTGDERAIAATTTPEPTSGLVFYDLKTCLRSLAPELEQNSAEQSESGQSERAKPAAKPRRTTKKASQTSEPQAGETKADA